MEDYSVFDPNCIDDDMDFEGYPEDANCTVINGGTREAKELFLDNETPVLVMPRRIYDEVAYLVDSKPHDELAMFLVVKQMMPSTLNYKAVALFIPEQEASSMGVSIEPEDCSRFYKDMKVREEFKENLHRRLVHLHSHASMDTFWSSVDTNQQSSRSDLGYFDDYRFYVVTNTKREFRLSFVQYFPMPFRKDNIPLVVEEDGSVLSDDRKSELDASMAECWKSGNTGDIWQGVLKGFKNEDSLSYKTACYMEASKGRAWEKSKASRDWKDGVFRWDQRASKWGGYYEEPVRDERYSYEDIPLMTGRECLEAPKGTKSTYGSPDRFLVNVGDKIRWGNLVPSAGFDDWNASILLNALEGVMQGMEMPECPYVFGDMVDCLENMPSEDLELFFRAVVYKSGFEFDWEKLRYCLDNNKNHDARMMLDTFLLDAKPVLMALAWDQLINYSTSLEEISSYVL